MLCDQVREHLSAYLDRELAADLSAAVRAHLDACAECRALAADLRATVDLLGRLPARPAPGHLADDVMREIERRGILAIGAPAEPELQERTLPMRRPRFWPRALAVAATLVLALGIGILAYLGQPQAPPVPGLQVAMERTDTSKVSDKPESLADSYVAPGKKQAEKVDDFATQRQAPAAAPAERPPAEPDAHALALLRKMPQVAPKTSSLKIDGNGTVEGSNLKALDGRGARLLDAAGKAPPQAVTLAWTARPEVFVTVWDKDAVIGRNYGLVGRTWNFSGDVGQVTLTLNGAPVVGGTGGTMSTTAGTTLASTPGGAFWGLRAANGRTVTLGNGAAAGYGLVSPQPPAATAPPRLDLNGASTSGLHFVEMPAAPVQAGYAGRTYSQDGAVVLAGTPAKPAKAELQQKPGNTYSGATTIAGGAVTESVVARAPTANTEIAAAGRDLTTGGGSPAAGKPAAAKARGTVENASAALRLTMLAAAAGEAGIERLSEAATGDAVRAAANQLVIRAESPDAADRNLVELFKAAGWRPLAADRARFYADKERENRLGAGDYAYGPAATERFAKAIPPGGVYYRATRDGEDVWLVLADRDSISRFGSQLALAQGLAVAAESSTDFRAIRGLQEQLRRQSELAGTGESGRRASGAGDFGGAELAKAGSAPATAVKPSAGRFVAAAPPATAAPSATSPLARDEKQLKEDLGAAKEGEKPVALVPPAAPTPPAAPAVAAGPAPAAAPVAARVAAAAEAKTQKLVEAAGAAAATAAKPAPGGAPGAGLYYQEGGRGRAGGESGGAGGGGGAPLKGAEASSKAKAEEKPQSQLEAEYAKAPPALRSGPAPADRILLVIRVQAVLASRIEADRAAPAATQPAPKPAP